MALTSSQLQIISLFLFVQLQPQPVVIMINNSNNIKLDKLGKIISNKNEFVNTTFYRSLLQNNLFSQGNFDVSELGVSNRHLSAKAKL